MRKQFHKIKVAAENLRFNKSDKNSEELQSVEKQCDRYRDVLQALTKKFVPPSSSLANASNDPVLREKRLKKVQEYTLGQVMEESCKELTDGLLRKVLENCAKLEKTIANEIVTNELNVENEVSRKLNSMYETHMQQLQKQKRIVTKCFQDNEVAKQRHQSATQMQQQNPTKTTQLKDDQEECELKLEKERDIYASMMFELLAEEESISNYIINYIKYQEQCYKSALNEIEAMMGIMNELLRKTNKKVFNISLDDHLKSTGRKISYVIELCVCCLLEKGLDEEGLLRVGCASSKLKRMRSAIDANYIGIPVPGEYQDCHVIAAVLKNYLRSLPDPLLTYEHLNAFMMAACKQNEAARKAAILNVIHKLPEGNYDNLRYLTRFLSLVAQNNQVNKMSSQNVAIVMSPNLLWPQEEEENNYMQQVNSTAAVNTIVDALISDWSYFFDGDVDFYMTMTRDDLFPDNGGFPQAANHKPPACMSQSMNATISGQVANNLHLDANSASSRTHSRSSSHDTSLILYAEVGGGGEGGERPKNSQSNSSLDSQPSPVHGSSPKLPARKKHNKPAAPPAPNVDTPQKVVLTTNTTQQSQKIQSVSYKNVPSDSQPHSLTFNEQNPKASHAAQSNLDSRSQLFRAGSIDNLSNNKADKPPRPVFAVPDYHSLNRTPAKTPAKPDLHTKPVALPRFLSGAGPPPPKPPPPHFDDDNAVQMREKPAIPDRPASLMRLSNFKGSVPEITKADKCESTSAGGGIKKAQSFRSDQKPVTHAQTNDPLPAHHGHSERTQIYNIDKKQVAIVDVVEHNNRNAAEKLTLDPALAEKEAADCLEGGAAKLSGSHTDLHHVPVSPRGFDPKVKRPQVPAPPPPRPTAPPMADSTNL